MAILCDRCGCEWFQTFRDASLKDQNMVEQYDKRKGKEEEKRPVRLATGAMGITQQATLVKGALS